MKVNISLSNLRKLSPAEKRKAMQELSDDVDKNAVANLAIRLGALAKDKVPTKYIVIFTKGGYKAIKAYNRQTKRAKIFRSDPNGAIRFAAIGPKEELIYYNDEIYGKL